MENEANRRLAEQEIERAVAGLNRLRLEKQAAATRKQPASE